MTFEIVAVMRLTEGKFKLGQEISKKVCTTRLDDLWCANTCE
jgi:hypothetical protein